MSAALPFWAPVRSAWQAALLHASLVQYWKSQSADAQVLLPSLTWMQPSVFKKQPSWTGVV